MEQGEGEGQVQLLLLLQRHLAVAQSTHCRHMRPIIIIMDIMLIMLITRAMVAAIWPHREHLVQDDAS